MSFITQNFLASTIKANGVTLSSSFSYSQLDLQDNGPINVANNLHQQKWTPTDKFIDSPEGSLQGGNIVTDGFSGNPLVPGSGFLDLENNGPTNVANYNHQQNWTPTDKFIDSPEGSKQGGNLKSDGFSGNPAVPGTGFLDLENNGPTNVANYNHQQKWTPTDEFILSPEGSKQGGNLKNDGFGGPSGIPGTGFLDLENNGPNNVANYNHQQKWTPTDEYILNPQGQLQGGNLKKYDRYKIDDENVASLNPVINVPLNNHQQIYNPLNQYEDSPQGRIRSTDSSAEKNNFKTSALDLEDPLAGINPPPGSNQGAGGGPNRTNAIQSKKAFQSGQYTTTRAGGPGFGGNDVGGVIIKQTLHRYTPQNSYLDNTPIQTSEGWKPKNNIAIEGEANGFNATI